MKPLSHSSGTPAPESRPSAVSRVAFAAFSVFVVTFGIAGTLAIWSIPALETGTRLALSAIMMVFTLTTLAALAGHR